MRQQPSSTYLRFCRVATVAYCRWAKAQWPNLTKQQQLAYYNSLLCCGKTGNAAVAKLQAKGFAFTLRNTHALVQHLHAVHKAQCLALAQQYGLQYQRPMQPGNMAASLPSGIAVALRQLGGSNILGVASSSVYLMQLGKGCYTLSELQHTIVGY